MTEPTNQYASSMQTIGQPAITISPTLFTSTRNLDFNSDDDEDFEYNPFAGFYLFPNS